MMSELLEKFLSKHDPTEDLSFASVKFRPGALFSVGPPPRHNAIVFSLTEGYKRDNAGNLTWGWVRIHTGDDRGATPSGSLDVWQPFAADRTALEEDTDFTVPVYGALIRLISDAFGFEVRIAHMNPRKDFAIGVASDLRAKRGSPAGRKLGHAGSYGVGQFAHTHTEIVSLDQSAPVLEEILHRKFSDAASSEYTPGEVHAEYRRQVHTEKLELQAAIRDYEMLKTDRDIVWCNRFKHIFKDRYSGGAIRTRYSSRLLFGM